MTLFFLLGWAGGTWAVASYAKKQNRSPVPWALMSFFFSPLLAGIVLLAKGSNVQEISVCLFKGRDKIRYVDVPVSRLRDDEIKINVEETEGEQIFKHLDTIPAGDNPENYFYYVQEGHEEYGSPARIN